MGVTALQNVVRFYVMEHARLRGWLRGWLNERDSRLTARTAWVAWLSAANAGYTTPEGPFKYLYQTAANTSTDFCDQAYGTEFIFPWHMLSLPTSEEICEWSQMYALVHEMLQITALDGRAYGALLDAVAGYDVHVNSYTMIIQGAAEHGQLITLLRPVVDALEVGHDHTLDECKAASAIWQREDLAGQVWLDTMLNRLMGDDDGAPRQVRDHSVTDTSNAVSHVEGHWHVRPTAAQPD